jgi:hypothetical protein
MTANIKTVILPQMMLLMLLKEKCLAAITFIYMSLSNFKLPILKVK